MAKLVRDRIPEIAENREFKVISGMGLRGALLNKLLEEAQEVVDSAGSEEEIADVLEVVDGIVKEFGLDLEEIHRIKEKKKEERGGFCKGIFMVK